MRTRASASGLVLLLSALVRPASVVADAGPTCPADDALSNAAATLLLAGNAPDSNTLVAAVREAGSDAVLVHALFQPHDDAAATQKWLAELRAVSDADLVCGEASGSAGRLLIASARAGSLLPLTAASSVVRGTLAPGFDHPELVISAADGTLTRLGLEPSMLHDGIPLQEDLARPAKIQLLARGHAGPRPIAERELPATRSRAHAIAALPPTAAGSSASTTAKDATANDLAALLVIRLNSLRAERERLAVRDNRLLATLATAHARAVCQAGKLAHELSPGQDPEARVEQAGIRARLVGETIARAGDAGSAFAELGESPSHLLTLLEPRFTDVGVGVAHDSESRSCVVVLLAAWPRYVGR